MTNMKDVAPTVRWNDPKVVPVIELYSEKEFWVAVKSIHTDRNGNVHENEHVFCAQYVNRPVTIDEEGNADNDNYFSDQDGEPLSCIGWYSVQDHADFDNFYAPLGFSDSYILLGWAEHVKPTFK